LFMKGEGIKVASPRRAGGLVRGSDEANADATDVHATKSHTNNHHSTTSHANNSHPANSHATDSAEIRRMLARELHDRVAQTLTSMLIELENFKVDQIGNQSVLREVDVLQESTRDVLNNLRHVLYDLRGHASTEEGFVESVRALLARFQEKTHVKAILSISPAWPPSLPSAAALNLLRIIEESLTNVRLHSGARLVEVALGPAAGGQFAVEIRDDGRGAESGAGHRAPGLGTLGMRERALILGGRLEVETADRGGTTVRVILAKEQLI
jgi:two-component system sensor histidine kinase UhpB